MGSLLIIDRFNMFEFDHMVDRQGLQGKVGGGWLVETERDNRESAWEKIDSLLFIVKNLRHISYAIVHAISTTTLINRKITEKESHWLKIKHSDRRMQLDLQIHS